MWFFEAILEYRGKHNSNIGKKRSTKLDTRAGLSPDRGRCDGFSFAESSKIKNWTSSRKKTRMSEVLFSQVHSTSGCTRAWIRSMQCTTCFECYNTKFSMHCAMSLQYFWNPLTGFFTFECNSKNPVRGFRNNTDRQLALKCPEDKMVGHLQGLGIHTVLEN